MPRGDVWTGQVLLQVWNVARMRLIWLHLAPFDVYFDELFARLHYGDGYVVNMRIEENSRVHTMLASLLELGGTAQRAASIHLKSITEQRT